VSAYGQLLAQIFLLDVVAHPQGGQGFAAYLLGGFLGLGVIVLVMILLSLKPKRADPRSGADQQREQDQADEQ
jgi:hypothetical protein